MMYFTVLTIEMPITYITISFVLNQFLFCIREINHFYLFMTRFTCQKSLLNLYAPNPISLTSDCYFRQKEWLFALADYQQAEELDPQNKTIRLRLAVIHNTLGLHSYEKL